MNSSGSVVSTKSSVKVFGLKILRYADPGRIYPVGLFYEQFSQCPHAQVSHYEHHSNLDQVCWLNSLLGYLHRNSALDNT